MEDKPKLLPNVVAPNFILPLPQLSGSRIDPYLSLTIFLHEGLVQLEVRPGVASKKELKDSDDLLPHTKLSPKLLESCGFDQQGEWKDSYKGKEVLT